MAFRDWFWQLQAAGQGPDWYFHASFAPSGGAPLAALAERPPPPGFARYRAADTFCARHGHRSDHDIYIDERNYAALAANHAGAHQRNIWIYHTITICGADLTIERGDGGYPGAHGASETGLVLRLAEAGGALAEWSVAYGGQGYAPGQVAAGAGLAELRDYLQED